MIGTSSIVRAEPDGYTLGGIWNAPLTMTPHTLKAQYSPDDYVAVSLSDSAPIVLCTKDNFLADKIGRAASRERVCQVVEMSVGGVYVKRKHNNIINERAKAYK